MKLLVFVLLLCSINLYSQKIDTLPPPEAKRALIFIPIVFRTPETSWGFGAGVFYQHRFVGSKKTSLAQAGGVYTLRKQLITFLSYEAYPSDPNYRFQIELGYYHFVYDFFGIGNHVSDESESYDARFPRIKALVSRQLWKDHFIGLRYYFDGYKITRFKTDGVIANSDLPGKTGGNISKIGLNYLLDKRDNHIYCCDGWYIEATAFLENKLTGSAFNENTYILDARYFQKLKFGTLAYRILSRSAYRTIAFYDLPYIGGNKGTRGFLDTKYRDNQSLELNMEYRFPIWRFIKGCVFIGAGQVAPKINKYNIGAFHIAGGTGLRFGISKKDPFNIGFDVAYGEGDISYYLNFGEAF